MSWIIVEDKFAKEATPDPTQFLDATSFNAQIEQKQQEVTMYESEIAYLTTRKTDLETEIAEMQALLEA